MRGGFFDKLCHFLVFLSYLYDSIFFDVWILSLRRKALISRYFRQEDNDNLIAIVSIHLNGIVTDGDVRHFMPFLCINGSRRKSLSDRALSGLAIDRRRSPIDLEGLGECAPARLFRLPRFGKSHALVVVPFGQSPAKVPTSLRLSSSLAHLAIRSGLRCKLVL